ncbi:MAG: N-acyl homoserine lactonase family protein [Cyclobacteriaceae bacterium]|nr:N-acyl homoserine lactonase family protein [Cyclobacteriaceae bacterium]
MEHLSLMEVLTAPPKVDRDLSRHGIFTRVIDGVKIHAVTCGWIKYRNAHFHSILGPYLVILDPTWMDWIPVFSWVIEHPEGIIVVDTGQSTYLSTDTLNKGGMNGWLNKQLARMDIDLNTDIKAQLGRLNICPDDVRWVVLTHLHVDHAGGLRYFPKSEVLVSHQEYVRPYAFVDGTYPSWFKPHLIGHYDDIGGVFEQGHVLTRAGDVVVVPTPGHSMHHQSVIFRNTELDFFFAGDASFNFSHVQSGFVPGINLDRQLAKQTLDQIKGYCIERPTAYLPSHDQAAVNRFFR